jgi:hypothetical protein
MAEVKVDLIGFEKHNGGAAFQESGRVIVAIR